MQAHQDDKSIDQPIKGSNLRVGQWIQFRGVSQPDEGPHPSQKMQDRIFLVYARDVHYIGFWQPLTYKLIDPSGRRYAYIPEYNQIGAENVRSCQIFLLPSEEAKTVCGPEGLQAINTALQVQLPQDAHERSRKHYPPIETINRFNFQNEVAEFLKLQEGSERVPSGPTIWV